MVKKRKYVCYGCGKSRPCYLVVFREEHLLVDQIEDLRCVLDETNQTSYNWEHFK